MRTRKRSSCGRDTRAREFVVELLIRGVQISAEGAQRVSGLGKRYRTVCGDRTNNRQDEQTWNRLSGMAATNQRSPRLSMRSHKAGRYGEVRSVEVWLRVKRGAVVNPS